MDWAKTVTMVFQIFSTAAIVAAAIKFIWGRDQRSGETLLHLEERFKDLQSRWAAEGTGKLLPPITQIVDREAHLFEDSDLKNAIELGLADKWDERDELQKAWVSRLDEFLRFLLLVAAMQRSHLLRKRALWDAYHYWFRTVVITDPLNKYVERYFPVLDGFLKENKEEIQKYNMPFDAKEGSTQIHNDGRQPDL